MPESKGNGADRDPVRARPPAGRGRERRAGEATADRVGEDNRRRAGPRGSWLNPQTDQANGDEKERVGRSVRLS